MSENIVVVAETSTVELVNVEKPKPNELEDTANTPSYDLRKFRLTRVLNNNTKHKICALLGTFPDLSETDEAIVVFEKQPFRESDIQTTPIHNTTANGSSVKPANNAAELCSEGEEARKPSYFSNALKVNTVFVNNIYGSFQCVPGVQSLNEVKTMVVYPATEKHIEKYSICQKYIVSETPAFYEKLTLPYIESSQFSLDWVYNILEHKQEVDRIVYEDCDQESGFILVPDMKWDGKNVESLYLLAITHKRDIKSLRDLRVEHLPLLRNIRKSAASAIELRYGLPAAQLRMYLHYQPSFYHLHIHINPVRNDAPGIWCEKSHMLDTVINNIELLPEYYRSATLPFVIYEGHKLLELYEKEVPLRKAVKRAAAEETEETHKLCKKAKCGDNLKSKVKNLGQLQAEMS